MTVKQLETAAVPSRKSEFLAGAQATIPLIIGAVPFGIIFGALAISSNLSPWAAIGLSAIVFAGSSQFIGVNMVAQGAPTPLIIFTTFVVNARHGLYSATLASYVKHLSAVWTAVLAFLMTDEAFVVVVRRYQQTDSSPYKHWYFLGSGLSLYISWQLSTIIGIVASQLVSNPAEWGLDFALTVTFIGMLVPMLVNRPMVAAAVTAGVSAVLLNGLAYQLGLLVAALMGILVGWSLERMRSSGTSKRAEVVTE